MYSCECFQELIPPLEHAGSTRILLQLSTAMEPMNSTKMGAQYLVHIDDIHPVSTQPNEDVFIAPPEDRPDERPPRRHPPAPAARVEPPHDVPVHVELPPEPPAQAEPRPGLSTRPPDPAEYARSTDTNRILSDIGQQVFPSPATAVVKKTSKPSHIAQQNDPKEPALSKPACPSPVTGVTGKAKTMKPLRAA